MPVVVLDDERMAFDRWKDMYVGVINRLIDTCGVDLVKPRLLQGRGRRGNSAPWAKVPPDRYHKNVTTEQVLGLTVYTNLSAQECRVRAETLATELGATISFPQVSEEGG